MSLFDLWWYATAALVGHALGVSARRFVEDGKDVARRLRPPHPPVQPGPPESIDTHLGDCVCDGCWERSPEAQTLRSVLRMPAPPKPTRGYE